MLLSVKELLDHVTKLRRCSGVMKLQSVWYMATGRERNPHQKCWSLRICSGGKENPHDRQIWRTCTRFKNLWSCKGAWSKNPLTLSWVANMKCISLSGGKIWTAGICAPRSTARVPFQNPFIVLPLTRGGGDPELSTQVSMA
jgi:hypothetical protein